MRWRAVAFAEGERKLANCASATRAFSGVGPGGAVGVEEPVVEVGGGAGLGGVTGESGTVDCDALAGTLEEGGDVATCSAASTLLAAATFSDDALAVNAAMCGCSEGWSRVTLTGITGGDVGSARGVSVGGAIGFEVGHLSTPPTWNVVHHGQSRNWFLSSRVEDPGSTGATLGAVFAIGPATGRKASEGWGTWIRTDGGSCDLAGALVSVETAAI
jgi:hypothetical protein